MPQFCTVCFTELHEANKLPGTNLWRCYECFNDNDIREKNREEPIDPVTQQE